MTTPETIELERIDKLEDSNRKLPVDDAATEYREFTWSSWESYYRAMYEHINRKGANRFMTLWLAVNEGIRNEVADIHDYDYSDSKNQFIQFKIAYRMCCMTMTRQMVMFNRVRKVCGKLVIDEMSPDKTMEFCEHPENSEESADNCQIQYCPFLGKVR